MLIVILLSTLTFFVYLFVIFNKVPRLSPENITIPGTSEQLKAMVDSLQLTYVEQNSEFHQGGWIHGTFQDVSINIQDDARAVHRDIHISTRYEALLDEFNAIDGLEVLPEKNLAKVKKVFGAQDIQTGDEQFDNAFIIRAPSPQDALDLFACPDVRRNFLNLRKLCPDFRFQHNTLTLEYPNGILQNQPLIPARLQALADCTHAIINQNKKTTLLTHQPTEPAQLETASSNW